MSEKRQSVSDLLSVVSDCRQTVEARIEQRLVVLREWLTDGVPQGQIVPKSLTAARNWADPGLGIYPIKSPNEFTTTNKTHGSKVRDILNLLAEIKKRSGNSNENRESRGRVSEAPFDRKAYEYQLAAITSQWQTERSKHLAEKRRADSAEARNAMLLEEGAEKEALISDLRRQLADLKKMRAIG